MLNGTAYDFCNATLDWSNATPSSGQVELAEMNFSGVHFVIFGSVTPSCPWVNATGQESTGATYGLFFGLIVKTCLPLLPTLLSPDGLFGANWTGGNSIQLVVDPSETPLPVFEVNFSEVGLTPGTTWYVHTGGIWYGSATSTIAFVEPNGSHTWSVSVVRYTAEPSGGSFVVAGTSVSVSVSFVPFIAVNFTESGLPPGTQWWVNITGMNATGTTGNTVLVYLPNGSSGSHTYTVSTADKRYSAPAGSFTVSGSNVSVVVAFTLVTYTVTFVESGLPNLGMWSVTLNGITETGSAGQYSFVGLPNGTYAYLLSTSGAIRVSAPTPAGTITVMGANLTVPVRFVSGPTLRVTFAETGLPRGTSWCVSFQGRQACSTNASLKFVGLTPGTYVSYAVVPLTGEVITARWAGVSVPLSGPLLVWMNAEISLRYVYPYTVTFSETGLPAGTSWCVKVGGVTHCSTGTSVSLQLKNGTYLFRIAPVSGYTRSSTPYPLHVAGAPASVLVTFRTKLA